MGPDTTRRWDLRILRWNDPSQFFDEQRQFMDHGIPDDVLVYIHVIVHDLIPHTRDGIPRNLWVPLTE